MTLIQIPAEDKVAPMDMLGKSQTKEDSGKSLRPVRNRRYTRLVHKNDSFTFSFSVIFFVRHSRIMEHATPLFEKFMCKHAPFV